MSSLNNKKLLSGSVTSDHKIKAQKIQRGLEDNGTEIDGESVIEDEPYLNKMRSYSRELKHGRSDE